MTSWIQNVGSFRACPFPPGSIVWLYLRYSDPKQNLESQEQFMRDWCKENFLIIGRLFKDEARTGTHTAGREHFLEMMDALESDPAPRPVGVVVWDLKRWARNYDDSMYYAAKVRRMKYKLVPLADNTPDTREGRILESIHAYSAEDEAMKRRDETKRGLHGLAAEGYSTGGFPPRGYKEGTKIEIGRRKSGEVRYACKWEFDMDLHARVSLAWEMKLNGASHWDIHAATHLYANARAYTGLFNNCTYAGARKCGETIKWDAHPAYVTRAEFERVQALRKPKRIATKDPVLHPRRRERNNHYLLSGLLRCGQCGWAMVGSNNGRQRTYRCDWRHRQGHAQADCKQPSLVAHVIHDTVLEWLARDVFTFKALQSASERVNTTLNGSQRALRERRTFLYAEKKRISTAIHNLVSAIERGGFVSEIKERWDQRRVELSEVETEIAEIDARIGHGTQIVDEEVLQHFAETMPEQLVHMHQAESPDLRAFVQALISKVELHLDKLTIWYSVLPFVETLARQPMTLSYSQIRISGSSATGCVMDSAAYAALSITHLAGRNHVYPLDVADVPLVRPYPKRTYLSLPAS